MAFAAALIKLNSATAISSGFVENLIMVDSLSCPIPAGYKLLQIPSSQAIFVNLNMPYDGAADDIILPIVPRSTGIGISPATTSASSAGPVML